MSKIPNGALTDAVLGHARFHLLVLCACVCERAQRFS
jgi:hypothetical protein